jgi:hypothetical protein
MATEGQFLGLKIVNKWYGSRNFDEMPVSCKNCLAYAKLRIAGIHSKDRKILKPFGLRIER